ncbi:MAG: ABC transporter permease [Verrucomicrobia bacterium]|nr:ABC transporter permease [Verrucomicrobiota bacterium]
MRGIRHIDTIVQDLRFGVRMLRRNPGLTCVAVLTLALGIGANTAIFSIVNAVLLRSLPYRDPDRLVMIGPVSGGDFLEWRDQAKTFEQFGAYTSDLANLTGGSGEPERLYAARASANLFATFGVAPALGRAFTPAEDTDGGPPVVILSDSLWRRRFGGDPQVIGQALTLEGQSRTIVGIMPPGFRTLDGSGLWLPLAVNVAQEQSGGEGMGVFVIARLKPGMTPEAARADLSAILERKRRAFPNNDSDIQLRVIGLSDWLVSNVRLTLLMLFGAVAFVLLIACANVANLLLARSATRQKEMAIRAAVGAGRLRLVRQLLTESLLLSVAGGAAGLLAAKWGVRLLVALSPTGIARIEETSVDGRVLGFTCVVVLLTGLMAGLFPALQASKVDVNETLEAALRDALAWHPRGSGVRHRDGRRLRRHLLRCQSTHARDRHSDGIGCAGEQCVADGYLAGNELDADRLDAGIGSGACPDARFEEPVLRHEFTLQRERDRSGDLRAHNFAAGRCRPDCELHSGTAGDEG